VTSSAGGAGDGYNPTAHTSLSWVVNSPVVQVGWYELGPLRGKKCFLVHFCHSHPQSEKQAGAETYESDSCFLLSQQACTYPCYCTKIPQRAAAPSSKSVSAIQQSLIGFRLSA